jgi:hypothetical protein
MPTQRQQATIARKISALPPKPLGIDSQIKDPLSGKTGLLGGNLRDQGSALGQSLAAIPAIRYGDATLSGLTKISAGFKLQGNEFKSLFPKLSETQLKGVGALGGALAISGMSEMATSFLPSYASIPLSAFGGYVAGSSAFGALGGNAALGGIAGAALGIGFAIYGIGTARRERRRAQERQAEAIAEHTEAVMHGIKAYQNQLPLIADQEKLLQEQYVRNVAILDLNAAQNSRVNFNLIGGGEFATQATGNWNFGGQYGREAKRAIGNLNVQLAQAGFVSQGLGWFLKGDIEDSYLRGVEEENWRFQTERIKLNLQFENLFGEFKAKQNELLYARYQIQNEIDYAKRVLARNLGKLASNPMAGHERQERARAGMALASSLGSMAEGGTKRLERAYYG